MTTHSSIWEKASLLTSDFVIIGAGFTGLYAAMELLEKHPSKRVVILERGNFSRGASTRNAGFACFGNISEILLDLQDSPEDEVYALMADRYRGLKKIQKMFGENRVDLNFDGSHEIFSAKNESDWHMAMDYLPRANQLMLEATGIKGVFHPVGKPQELPFRSAIGAIGNPYEGHLNTGKLYRMAWQRATRMGAEIYGGAEVKSWLRQGNHLMVEVPSLGSIRASQLFICNNAFAARLIPEAAVLPARGQVLVSAPMQHHLKGIYHFDHGYYYWRALGDRILIGGARNMDAETEQSYEWHLNAKIQAELYRFVKEEVLQQKEDFSVDYRWSGTMGFGPAKSPIVKTISPGVHLGVRLGGMGVALSSVLAERIAALVEG